MDVEDRMVFEAERLSTFRWWPFGGGAACSPERMAEAGFFAAGGRHEPDLAVCFLCGKQMNGWDETDDPWGEHRDHAAQCMFAQLSKPERDMTVLEFSAVCIQFESNKLNRARDDVVKRLASEFDSFRADFAKKKKKLRIG